MRPGFSGRFCIQEDVTQNEIPSQETLRAMQNVKNGVNLSREFHSIAELKKIGDSHKSFLTKAGSMCYILYIKEHHIAFRRGFSREPEK